MLPPDAQGWFRLRSSEPTNRVQTIQVSTDLRFWRDAAVFHGGDLEFSDGAAPGASGRFYRMTSRPRTSADDGRNQLTTQADPFLVSAPGDPFDTPVLWRSSPCSARSRSGCGSRTPSGIRSTTTTPA